MQDTETCKTSPLNVVIIDFGTPHWKLYKAFTLDQAIISVPDFTEIRCEVRWRHIARCEHLMLDH